MAAYIVLSKLKEGVSLSRGEVLRCKVRYFSEGRVIGTKDFVERMMEVRREWFAPGRRRKTKELSISGSPLFSLR